MKTNLKNRYFVRFSLRALLVLSVMFTSVMYYPTEAAAPQAFSPLSNLATKYIGDPLIDDLTPKQLRMLIQAQKLENYLARYDGNLKDYSYELVKYAYEYDLPYNLVAAIGVIESGACTHNFAENNCFGWGNKVDFESVPEAIRTVSLNLGGQNPRTANFYKPEYSVEKKMSYYNSVNPDYMRKLNMVMAGIDKQDWQ